MDKERLLLELITHEMNSDQQLADKIFELVIDIKNSISQSKLQDVRNRASDFECACAFLFFYIDKNIFYIDKNNKKIKNTYLKDAKDKIKPWLGKSSLEWKWLFENE